MIILKFWRNVKKLFFRDVYFGNDNVGNFFMFGSDCDYGCVCCNGWGWRCFVFNSCFMLCIIGVIL